MLLVVTNKADLACDYLILRLKERRLPFRRLNTEDYGEAFDIDMAPGSKSEWCITFSDGQVLDDDTVSAVYFRQPRAPAAPDDISDTDKAFTARELKETLRGLWRLIDERKWLNHPRRLWLASNKPEQLSVAAKLDFRLPETVITRSPKKLASFYARHGGRIICKAVKNGFSHDDMTVTLAMTRRVEKKFVDNFASYAAVPMIYQREIPKAYDVRVTIVGDQLFATAIHSQERAETEVDWRLWDVGTFDLKHEPITLPAEVAAQCRAITAHYRLGYAAIDLIFGAEGQYYFLEVNPNGQWAWIEQKAGFPIRDAIIDSLTARSPVYA